MLTVESLAGFRPFWRKIVPFESNFIKYKLRDADISRDLISVDSSEWDVVAEYAFHLASRIYTTAESERLALAKVAGLRGGSGGFISEEGRTASEALSQLITSDIERFYSLSDVEWKPSVPGFGALSPSEADAISGSTLIEIKNVDRFFHAPDLRQILLYCSALNAIGRSVDSFFLVNSRKSVYIRAKLQHACRRMSGRSWLDVRSEIEGFLLTANSWFADE